MSEQNDSAGICPDCGRLVVAHVNGVSPDGQKCSVMGPGRIGAERPSGLPQSALGGLHPELLARITAAKIALGSFEAELTELRSHGILVDYLSWAQRFHAELRGLLETIERLGK